jgi:hypothetical protein
VEVVLDEENANANAMKVLGKREKEKLYLWLGAVDLHKRETEDHWKSPKTS